MIIQSATNEQKNKNVVCAVQLFLWLIVGREMVGLLHTQAWASDQ